MDRYQANSSIFPSTIPFSHPRIHHNACTTELLCREYGNIERQGNSLNIGLRCISEKYCSHDYLLNVHFTITTQQQRLDVLGSVLNVLTIAAGALGGISLLLKSCPLDAMG